MIKRVVYKRMQKLKRLVSLLVILTFIAAVIAIVAKIFLFRATLDQNGWGPSLCGMANAV